MTNTHCGLLIAILIASSTCLATESAQDQPQVAIITGEIRDPTSREIIFSYELPSALESSEERVVLDSLNRFVCELPVYWYLAGELIDGFESGQAMAILMASSAPNNLISATALRIILLRGAKLLLLKQR